jgi:hypothetical protein
MPASMPYPFAHPAAILPLLRPLGRFAVPSALAIGSIAPDFWYLAPGLARDASHGAAGLFWFCVPAGLLAYLAFHLLLKLPLLALAPPALAARLAAAAAKGLPRAGWAAVVACLLAGAATHLLWDALTHDRYVVNGFQALQHASTLAGSLVLALWLRSWYRRAAPRPLPPELRLTGRARLGVLSLLVVLSAGWALAEGNSLLFPASIADLREALRTTGILAAQAFTLSSIGYALLWKLLR